jgi:putative membrane protein
MSENEQQPTVKQRTFQGYLGLVARGFAMGFSNIVPGVSGGTMALILGIYEELITSIKSVLNPEAIKLALKFRIKRAMDLVPWQFLVAVAIGIFLAVFTMSFFLEWVLDRYPSLLWGFFFGLVVASTWVVRKQIQKWSVGPVTGMIVGAIGVFFMVGLVPAQTPDTWWIWFISGVAAICAMILPGFSGSFILVLLGKYEQLLSAVTNMQIGVLLLVIAGAGVGIVTFAQVLSWLLAKYHDTTVAVLMGLMIGALRKLWPWQSTVEHSRLTAPWTIILPLGLMIVGLAFVLVVDQIASRYPKEEHRH